MRARFLAALLLCVASPAIAAHYVEPTLISPTLLTPPPAENSAEWNADIDTIAAMQEAPAKEELAEAEAEIKMSPKMVAQVLPGVERAKYPKLFAMLDRVNHDRGDVSEAAKDYWKTRRPYIASDKVKALIATHANPSYPSGHTCGSFVWAEVLGQLFPESQAQLRARADEIAMHRVLVGMHYPADVEGGRRLALLFLGALSQSKAYQRDFAAAKAEVDAGGKQ